MRQIRFASHISRIQYWLELMILKNPNQENGIDLTFQFAEKSDKIALHNLFYSENRFINANACQLYCNNTTKMEPFFWMRIDKVSLTNHLEQSVALVEICQTKLFPHIFMMRWKSLKAIQEFMEVDNNRIYWIEKLNDFDTLPHWNERLSLLKTP